MTSLSKAECLADNWASAHPGPDRGKRTLITKSVTCEQVALKRDFLKSKFHNYGRNVHIKSIFLETLLSFN